MSRLLLLALALSCASLCRCQPTVGLQNTGLSDWTSGILTHFGGAQDRMDPNSPSFGTKEGSCGYGLIQKNLYPFFATAALSPQNKFFKAGPLNGCGQCFQIQCTDPRPGVCAKDASGQSASVTSMITDSCPECEADHIDIQSLSFAKIAPPGVGRIQMQYRRVACSPPADMKVSIDNFRSAGGWMRLTIEDTGGRGAVMSVAVRGSGSNDDFRPMTNKWGATWELSNAPQPPLDFRIVCDDGQVVTAPDVVKQNGGISGDSISFDTGVQFNIGGMVHAFGGPPSSDASMGGSSGGGGQDCIDVPAPGPWSCAEQKAFGKCTDPAFASYCAATCGRCTPSSAAAATTATASTSASAANPPTAAGTTQTGCTDTPPPAFSCESQKAWGKCGEAFMVLANYCAKTCGRCQGSPDTTPQPTPALQQPSGGLPSTPSTASQISSNSQNDPLSASLMADLGNLAAQDCTDIPPDSSATCAERKAWGQCNNSITTSHNFCAATCGRCSPGASKGSSRRMLRGQLS